MHSGVGRVVQKSKVRVGYPILRNLNGADFKVFGGRDTENESESDCPLLRNF